MVNYYYKSVCNCNWMPTMHIPDALFSAYVDRAGGYEEAKDEIKRTLRNGVKNADTEN